MRPMLQFPSRPARADDRKPRRHWKWAGSRCTGSVVHAVPSDAAADGDDRRRGAACRRGRRPVTRSPPIRKSRSASSCPTRPAAAPTSSRASCRTACARNSASRIVIENRGGAAGSIGTEAGREGGSGRLHRALHAQFPHHQSGDLFEAAVRHREGLRAGGDGRVAAADPGGASGVRAQHGEGAGRARQGQAGQHLPTHRSATARRAISPASCSSCAPAPA